MKKLTLLFFFMIIFLTSSSAQICHIIVYVGGGEVISMPHSNDTTEFTITIDDLVVLDFCLYNYSMLIESEGMLFKSSNNELPKSDSIIIKDDTFLKIIYPETGNLFLLEIDLGRNGWNIINPTVEEFENFWKNRGFPGFF